MTKLKATSLVALERVRRSRQPMRVKRFGKPVADIVAPLPAPRPADWLGCMKGTLEVTGDIVAPIGDLARWEALE